MSYEEETAERVRRAISRNHHFAEIRMFGGLCFMVDGNMCCGLNDNALMVRVGAAARAAALSQPHTRPMTMRGKSMGAFVLVDPGGYRTEAALLKWVQRGLDFVSTLPRKSGARGDRAT
jgi:TfoX/Sxy family transcriptional regulator of competence genes